MPDEIDVALLSTAPGLGQHRWATVRTPERGPLTLHPLGAARERHRLGFEQPVAGAADVAPESIGVVLVPGLAFCRDGSRLGRGGGYYDRLLATTVHAITIGVTLEALVFDELATEAHDLRVDLLATEHGLAAAGHGLAGTGAATAPASGGTVRS